MYRILHLPTGTYVKYNIKNPTDWSFISLQSAIKVMNDKLVVDFEKDIVMLDEVLWYTPTQKVLKDHLELIEIPDV